MDLPKPFKDLDSAIRYAWETSATEDFFFYIFRSNSGVYIVDISGVVYSDEELLKTYYKGLEQ